MLSVTAMRHCYVALALISMSALFFALGGLKARWTRHRGELHQRQTGAAWILASGFLATIALGSALADMWRDFLFAAILFLLFGLGQLTGRWSSCEAREKL